MASDGQEREKYMKTRLTIFVRLALALAAPALTLAAMAQANAPSFSSTGQLSVPRAGHSGTLLRNGKVLVTGGYNGTYTTTRVAISELYDPAAGTWTATGPLAVGRTTHTASLLSNAKVLAAGGHISGAGSTATCELYDPSAGSWSQTGAMATPRGSHTATVLSNGKVLVVGGYNRNGSYTVSTAELYDPASGTWKAAGSLATARNSHTATLLPDGKVLVAGGAPDAAGYSSLSSAELYDPGSGIWTATGPMFFARQYHTATLLPDGRVLVAGGGSDGYFLASAEIYDPVAGTWSETGPMGTARGIHTATLLPGGKVLVAGGNHNSFFDPLTTLSSTELYDPASGAWSPAGTLNAARTTHTAILLPNGKVLVSCGFNYNASAWLVSAEVYDSAVGAVFISHPLKRPGGAFQFAFTGTPNGTCSVLAATNPALPMTNWTVLGVAPEYSPGLFLFSDPEAANTPLRFYRVRSP